MSTARAFLPQLMACEGLPSMVDAAPLKKPGLAEIVDHGLAFYRKYTEGMMRRYMRCSMETGRVPAMLGKEMFRAKVTSYRVHSFEDLVIFVHDVDKCMKRLSTLHRVLITRIAIQQYTHQETAVILGMNRRTVVRRYDEAVDCLTAIFLEVKLLEPFSACQEGVEQR